jgi:hypothetical protein
MSILPKTKCFKTFKPPKSKNVAPLKFQVDFFIPRPAIISGTDTVEAWLDQGMAENELHLQCNWLLQDKLGF